MFLCKMWKYVMDQTKSYRVASVSMIVGGLSSGAVAYVNSILYAKIIDSLMLSDFEKAVWFIMILVSSVFALNVIASLCDNKFDQLTIPCMEETRRKTCLKIFRMEYEEIEKKETLKAYKRIRTGETGTGDIANQLNNIYSLFKQFIKFIFAFGFLIVLIVTNSFNGIGVGKAVIMTLILFALFGGTFILAIKGATHVGKERNKFMQKLENGNTEGGYLFSVIEKEKYQKDIRIYKMQDFWMSKLHILVEICMKFEKFGFFLGKWGGFLVLMSQILAGYIYVYVAVMAAGGAISIGEVLMYAGAIITLVSGWNECAELYLVIKYSDEYLKLYDEIINKPNMHYDGTLPVEKRDDYRYELEFVNVSFKYPESENYVLKNVSLKFNIGEKMALVGLNGAGKTTLIKLLLRLYEPTEGEIRLNGINIGLYDYDEYVSIFSVVFQDFALFDFPLDENIAGSEDVDIDKVKKVIQQVGLSERVSKMKDKEHTLLNHNNGDGESLSGGEAQKVAIARALYKDAPFVILDEPTAALDPIAEADIYENFDTLIKEKTAIYVSHRMSSCKFCDRIIVIDEGTIAEDGNHHSLMELDGIYANLYNTQANQYVTAN